MDSKQAENGQIQIDTEKESSMDMCDKSENVAISVGREEKRGEAHVKTQYLIKNYVRKINLEYVSKGDQEALKSSSVESGKQSKLRGRNKRRYQDMKNSKEVKLCSHIIRQEECPYGDKCQFAHDVQKYCSTKKPDISDRCYTFETYGKCLQGLTCRFGSSHLSDDCKLIVNEELWTKHRDNKRVANALPKNVMMLLRKRNYNFDRANLVISSFSKLKNKPLTQDMNPSCESATDSNLAPVGELVPLANEESNYPSGAISSEDFIRVNRREIKKIDFKGKLFLAPLTTVGNLPFRRICKRFGADITCGEMALAQNLLQGQASEWALLKRHESEDVFGVQLCGAHGDQMTRCVQLLSENITVDFFDINAACPIDLIYRKGGGCGLMNRMKKFEEVIYGMRSVTDVPLTVKLRTGVYEDKRTCHELVPKLRDWGVDLICLHGRSREQRYTKAADWSYIDQCAKAAYPMPLFGCGDILSYEDTDYHLKTTSVSGTLIARGALLKPWIFTEIKEKRHWDISSSERFDLLKDYVNYGLEHWGSDDQGVENTRRFLLEWLSFLYRYIPVGVLDRIPQKINERPPYYVGRDDLETLMASPYCADWIKISEMLLGKVPPDFTFLPKHKANAYN